MTAASPDELYMAATSATPAIRGTLNPPCLRMQGDSYPENSFELFEPLLHWLQTQLASAKTFSVELNLSYLNTSSVRVMMEVFDLLQAAHERGVAVNVVWYFERNNRRAAELAEEFKEDLSLPFEIRPDAEGPARASAL